MKRAITIIAISVLLVSCIEDTNDYYRPEKRTQSGYTLFEYGSNSMSSLAALLTETEIFNSYYKADTAFRKEIVKNENWFANKQISVVDSDSTHWIITAWNGFVLDVTIKDGLPLSEIGAEWSVFCSTAYMTIKNSAATFKRVAADTMLLTLGDGWTRTAYAFAFNDVNLKFVYPAEDVLLRRASFTYTIEGTAACEAVGDREMTMNFVADELKGTSWYNSDAADMECIIHRGDMNVEANKGNEMRNVVGKYGTNLSITYQGVSEQYPLPRFRVDL